MARQKDRWMLRHIDFPPGAIQNWPYLKDIEIAFLPVYYSMEILPVAQVDENARTATLAVEASAPPFAMAKNWLGWKESMWVENVFAFLDEPGEWVLYSVNHRIYLWPNGDEPGDKIRVPGLRELIRVEGRIDEAGPVDKPVRNLEFKGLTFTQGDRFAKSPGWKGWGIQHDWEMFDKDTALLRFRGAEDCAVLECRFENSGGTGLRLDLHCMRVTVARNLFHHLGGMGILLCGYGPGTKDVNRENEIISNHIHHCGEIF
ncbi:MAG: right-handed parallel beta-helix repeat-containing protein [Verrucomicrobia bacterium]|nr:right-handed parallel beta-helix repeat-containing protein [Verrucomicrobiota bacterium]